MSREFDWRGNAYMHTILSGDISDRPKTGELLADALGDVYSALAPLEYAVATHQAGDGSVSDVLLAAMQYGQQAEVACAALISIIRMHRDTVQQIVRHAGQQKK